MPRTRWHLLLKPRAPHTLTRAEELSSQAWRCKNHASTITHKERTSEKKKITSVDAYSASFGHKFFRRDTPIAFWMQKRHVALALTVRAPHR